MHSPKNVLILIAAIFISYAAFAQVDNKASHNVTVDWTDLMIMDIENTTGSNAVTLTIDYGAQEAGAAVTDGIVVASDETTWLNWTVFTPNDAGARYDIDVSANTDFNNGWTLKATPTIGAVTQGLPAIDQARNLGTNDQRVVKDIPAHSWSGDGPSQGCKIKYEVIINDVNTISATDQTVQVTYTISKH